MASPSRATVTINGTKFNAVTASVNFTTEKDHAGVAKMGSLSTAITVWADMHDTLNVPFSTVQMLFNLANVVTTEKIVPMKIEYWKDDSQRDALLGYSFNGWVQRFETSNPLDFIPRQQSQSTEELLTDGVPPDLNHILRLELQPSLNSQNFAAIQTTN